MGAGLWISTASCACLVPAVLLLAGTALPGPHHPPWSDARGAFALCLSGKAELAANSPGRPGVKDHGSLSTGQGG